MKGALYTLEVVISILMIFVIVVFLFQNPPASPDYQIANYKLKAYNALKLLDTTGELNMYTSNSDANSIREKLQPFIPVTVSYDVVIFNQTTNITNKPSFVNVTDVISVSYFVSGELDDYQPRDVRVYLWGFI